MTRLSEALKRAAETAGTPAVETSEAAVPSTWEFSPVETMHVPAEPPLGSGREPMEPLIGNAGATQLATPAVLPAIQLGDADRDKIVIGDGVDPALMEQFRNLAAVLHHAQKAAGVRSVMVTSALPAEGKTLTATNLALTLSQAVQRYEQQFGAVELDIRRRFKQPG